MYPTILSSLYCFFGMILSMTNILVSTVLVLKFLFAWTFAWWSKISSDLSKLYRILTFVFHVKLQHRLPFVQRQKNKILLIKKSQFYVMHCLGEFQEYHRGTILKYRQKLILFLYVSMLSFIIKSVND